MAQLIKLKDYVSRYEKNLNQYASQFIHYKKKQWEEMKESFQDIEVQNKEFDKPRINSFLSKKRLSNDDQKPTTKNIDHLKRDFLDQIFENQVLWASSTLIESSKVDHAMFQNKELRYLLQRFPDSFLFMYKPVFKVQKAYMELDIILITPLEIICMTILNSKYSSVYIDTGKRFWDVKEGGKERKEISPYIRLMRTSNLVQSILNKENVPIKLKKVLLCENGYIISNNPNNIEMIDQYKYQQWFENMRNYSSPMKAIQMNAALALLKYVDSDSSLRSEWK
ncbi:hypothetical protein LC087_09195 [Bacillus carboniphilus]|uniref:NERD domain-containing protein n=1 Tax=Bacillus carboniphilus TaxID=86663 RepID=A0ABY9JP10_9BACI|nr:hypothetical protein [Bacillus carboniphilus]WLR41151.1 hypothetical protein LC087_09195 [Bacillus carboniphilus]